MRIKDSFGFEVDQDFKKVMLIPLDKQEMTLYVPENKYKQFADLITYCSWGQMDEITNENPIVMDARETDFKL